MTTADPQAGRDAVHRWFGLSYSNYLVLHRTLLQSMPDEWQARFVDCLEELHDAFSHVEQAQAYKVMPAVEREVSSLTDEDLASIGYGREADECGCYATKGAGGKVAHVPPACPHEVTYYDDHAHEISADHLVLWPIGRDLVPHYSRGRTRVEPRLP